MSAELWHGKALATVSDTSTEFWHGKALATVSNTSAQLGARQSLASPIQSLNFVCAKAWQTLTTVSWSVHLVHSTKTQLSLSHHDRSTLHDQAANTNSDHDAPAMQHPVHVRLAVWTALALQHQAHVRFAVRASNHIDTPPVNPTNSQKSGHRFTNLNQHQLPATIIQLHLPTTRPTSATRNNRPAALLRLDRHQLPTTIVQLQTRSTSATRIEHPTAPIYDSTIPAIDTNHLAEDTTTMNFTYALVNMTINSHLCYICYLAFVSFIVFWLSLLTRLT